MTVHGQVLFPRSAERPDWRERRERLLRAMVAYRRLVGGRLDALHGEEEVVLEDGTPVWLGEEEYAEEVRKYLRADRIVLSLHRLLNDCSTVVAGRVTELYVDCRASA